MDEIEGTPQETAEGRDGTERSEQRDLESATLDPRAQVEQSGDIRQAEEVQATFTAVVDNAGNATTPITQPVIDLSTTLIPLPGALVDDSSAVTDKSPGSGSEESSEDAAKKAVEDALKAFQKASGGTGQAAGQMGNSSAGESGKTTSTMGDAKLVGGTGEEAGQAGGAMFMGGGSGKTTSTMGDAKLVGGTGEEAGQAGGAMVGGSGKTTSTMGEAKLVGGTGEEAGQAGGAMVGGSGKTTSTMGEAKLVDATGEGAGQTTGAEEGDRATVEPPGRISVEPPGRISDEQGGAKPAAGDSVRQAAPAADSGPSAGESVRQAAPAADSDPSAGESVRQAAPPAESGPAAGDSVHQAAPPAESVPAAGDPVHQAAPPAESVPAAGDSVHQAAPPAESTTKVSESQGATVPPLEEQETGSSSAIPKQPGGEMNVPLPGTEEQGTGMDTAAVAPDENVEGQVSEEDLSEAKEGWTPPDVYMYYGPDGKIVIVDADGKPINCPPKVSSADGASFFAYYPGMVDENGDPIKFDIKDYKGSLTDLYLYQDSTGNMIVVDKNGNPVDSPPSVTSPDGATFYAYYGKAGTGESLQLQAYKGSLTDLYLYQDSTGNMIVVDKEGNPVSSPPSVTSPDGTTFYAYYGKAGTSEQVQLQAYKGSLTDLYLYQDGSGKTIVVDADGNPVASPPKVTSADGSTFYASYGKAGTGESVQLQAYKGSLTDLYLYQDSSGKTIVVDADGNPVSSPPSVTSPDGATFYAYYGKAGTSEQVQLQAYKGSLTDVYLYQDSSGKMIVVDATGKPLTSQPSITSPDGATFYASYAGGYKTGDMVQLQYYKPPSNKSKGGAPV